MGKKRHGEARGKRVVAPLSSCRVYLCLDAAALMFTRVISFSRLFDLSSIRDGIRDREIF